MPNIRCPICTVLGHVDHGKSSILDKIRHSNIVSKEAGAITQAIGASIIPQQIIKKITRHLTSLKLKLDIPGLLFIDTPGHAAFSNLRKRGGNLADIAILVVDVNEGFKPQTEESIEILKSYKIPFVIAANKIDLIHGWRNFDKKNILDNIKVQSEQIQQLLDRKLYEIVGQLSKYNLNSERFDRVEDYTKQIAIIPTSAKTGEGIPELIMLLAGLAQKFLEKTLKYDVKEHAKGTILEVKKEKGLGKILDVIIYDGSLKVGEIIVIGGVDKPIVTKVKALFEPKPLSEMRDKKTKFNSVKEVHAAIGVKVSALDIEKVIAGMPIRTTTKNNLEKVKRDIQKEIQEVLIETDKEGIIIKADSIGSLEALIKLFKEKSIPIRKALIGNIQKKDQIEAQSNIEKNPEHAVIIGFNIKDESRICLDKVKVITNDVVYKLIEDFEKWQLERKKTEEASQLDTVIKPCKIQIMTGYVFRQSNPAVCGVEILEGNIKVGISLMKKDGRVITEIKQLQLENKSISEAEQGKQVAASMDNVTIGRQVNENDILYSAIPEEDFRKLKKLKHLLKKNEINMLKEIAEIKRKENPMWGI